MLAFWHALLPVHDTLHSKPAGQLTVLQVCVLVHTMLHTLLLVPLQLSHCAGHVPPGAVGVMLQPSHMPAPLQSPPHSSSGSWLSGMAPHCPSMPPVFAPKHERQVPLHSLSQQTLSSQLSLWHSELPLHAAPTGCSGAHTPESHHEPLPQSLLKLHGWQVPDSQ